MKQSLKKILSVTLAVVIAAGMALALNGCAGSNTNDAKPTEAVTADAESSYTITDYPLTRNGVNLHLDCTVLSGAEPQKNTACARSPFSRARSLLRNNDSKDKLHPSVFVRRGDFSLPEMGSNLAVKVRYTLGSRKC